MTILNMNYKLSGDSGFTPGANTIAYYPFSFVSTVNDTSGNNKNLTMSGTSKFINNYFQANGSNGMTISNIGLSGKTQLTFSIWVSYPSSDSSFHTIFMIGPNTINTCIGLTIGKTEGIWTTNYGSQYKIPGTITANVRYNIIFTYNNGIWTHYVNNVNKGTRSQTITNTYLQKMDVGVQNGSARLLSGSMLGEFIIEDKIWTDAERTAYYNYASQYYGNA